MNSLVHRDNVNLKLYGAVVEVGLYGKGAAMAVLLVLI